MDREEVTKINPGLYEVSWVGGGKALAAVGITESGYRWIAATNFVGLTTDYRKLSTVWTQVEKLRRVKNG